MTENNKIICPNCKNELPQGSCFCQYCGNKIEVTIVENHSSKVEIKEEPITDEAVTPAVENEIAAKSLEFGIIEGQNAMEANRDSQPHNELDVDFGLVPQKPVYTVGIDEQKKYLKSLRTINGDPIKWNYRGSMNVDGINGMVDVYDTYLPSGEEYKTIYINMYGASNSIFAPKGFSYLSHTIAITNTAPKETTRRKTSKTKIALIITGLVAILTIAFIVFAVPAINYQRAMNLLDEDEYDAAFLAFRDLDDYSNSKEMVNECNYQKAYSLLEQELYDSAMWLFVELDDYSNSKEMVNECIYQKACSLLEEKSYDPAIDLFESLDNYRDSQAMLDECIYQKDCLYFKAVEYMDNGDYSDARDIFAKLGGYKDSADLLYACEYPIVCRWYDADGTLLLENRIKDGEKPIENPLPEDNDKWDYIKWEQNKDSLNNINFTAERELQNSYFVGNVFQIIVEDLGQTPVATGSAFVFNKDGWFITNAHVVDDAYYLKGIFNIPNNMTKESFTYLEIESGSYYHLDKDIYIGKLKNYQSISSYYKEFSFTQSYDIGQKTYSVGYPNSSTDLIINKGEVTNTWSNLYEKLYSGHSYICSSSAIAPGSSGGILINENLEILGMTTLGWFDDNGKFISGASISAYNYENLLKTHAKESSLIPHMERFHSDEKVYIGYYNEARDDEKNGLTERINMDDGSVIYVYEWTDEGTNSNGTAVVLEESLAVSSNGFMSYDSMYYWGNGSRREISFYGYYSNTRGLDDFVFKYKCTYENGVVVEIRCNDINYSPNLSLTLNKAYVVDAPYYYKISEDEYMKEQFNLIYESLRDDMARFK